MAVRQRCASTAPDSALRIPAGPQRQASRDLSQGVHRLPGDRWVCGIQPGAERNPLRLLEPRQTKMAGGHAGGRHSKDQQSKELPLLEEYFAWLNTLHPEKGSKLEDAVRYSLNQKQQLMAFLDYGEVPISNNLAENAIRPFTLGRKNWLFCDTPKGADASAVVYSLVESAALMPWAPDIQQEHRIPNSDAYVKTYLD